VVLGNAERGRRGLPHPVATLLLPPLRMGGFLGPRLQLSLPSFSGGTLEHPRLLQYSCKLCTDVMPVAPITVQLTQARQSHLEEEPRAAIGQGCPGWWLQSHSPSSRQARTPVHSCAGDGHGAEGGEDLAAILRGRPVLSLAFSNMVMTVDEPQALLHPAELAVARPLRTPGPGTV
jgi:hypothetical protein